MKNKKGIVIAVVVIVLLLVGILVLNLADFSSDNGGVTSTSEPSYTVFSTEVSDLLFVEVRTADLCPVGSHIGIRSHVDTQHSLCHHSHNPLPSSLGIDDMYSHFYNIFEKPTLSLRHSK